MEDPSRGQISCSPAVWKLQIRQSFIQHQPTCRRFFLVSSKPTKDQFTKTSSSYITLITRGGKWQTFFTHPVNTHFFGNLCAGGGVPVHFFILVKIFSDLETICRQPVRYFSWERSKRHQLLKTPIRKCIKSANLWYIINGSSSSFYF